MSLNHPIQKGGYIYIVKSNIDERAYKLGFTKSPKKRLNEYNKYGSIHCPYHTKSIIQENENISWEYIYLKEMKHKYPASVMEYYLFDSISQEFDPWYKDDNNEWEYWRYFKTDNDFIKFVDDTIKDLLSNKTEREKVLLEAFKYKFNIDDKFFSSAFYAQSK